MPGNPTLDEVADELYTLPPEQFVAARDERSRAVRSAGDRVLATEVAGLRRPTTSAWVLNLLVRDQPELLEQLLELGAELRAAQRELRGPQLRELAGQRQRVVAELVRAARRRAADEGHPVNTDTGYEVEQTLHAALADPDVARQVCTGRLVKPVTVAGFDAEPVNPAPAARPRRPGGAGAATAPETGPAAGPATEGEAGAADRAGGRSTPGTGGRPAGSHDGPAAGVAGRAAAGGGHGDRAPAGTGGRVADRSGAGSRERRSGAGESRQQAAERRRLEREQAERDRAEQEAARRRAEHDRLVAARDAAQADVVAAEAELADATERLAAAEQARTDAADLVISLEEQLNAARRAQRDSGGQIRDAHRRRTEAARSRESAAHRLADLTARLDRHPS